MNITPATCHGKARIKGTRVMASVVLDNPTQGANIEDLLASFHSLNREGTLAAMGYAAVLARDRIVDLSPIGLS